MSSMCNALAPLTNAVRRALGMTSGVDSVQPRKRIARGPRTQEEIDASQAAYQRWLTMLSGHQLNEIKEAFKKFDRDGSGFIDASELHATMKMMGATVTKEQVRGMIASVDDDGNGTVEFEEFLVIMARRILMHEGAMEMEAAIKLFEVDMRGRIECSEIRSLLCTFGEAPLSEVELDELLRLADPDGTGYCTLETFQGLPCWKLEEIEHTPVTPVR